MRPQEQSQGQGQYEEAAHKLAPLNVVLLTAFPLGFSSEPKKYLVKQALGHAGPHLLIDPRLRNYSALFAFVSVEPAFLTA